MSQQMLRIGICDQHKKSIATRFPCMIDTRTKSEWQLTQGESRLQFINKMKIQNNKMKCGMEEWKPKTWGKQQLLQ